VHRLCDEFDGWALSCHAPSLQAILAICPADVRVAAWVKPRGGFTPGQRYAPGWEPVIFLAGVQFGDGPPVRGWHAEDVQSGPAHTFPGRKPPGFAGWICDLLGYVPGDELVDLFPGSGALTRAFVKARQRDPEQFELVAT
jgi:hypothetical protein